MSETETVLIDDVPKDLTVTYTPASIDANFDTLQARVEKILADYRGCEINIEDKDQVKAAKDARKYLNGVAREIDERRKAVKREYEKPLKDFEARVKAITDQIKDVSGEIDAQVKAAEERLKEAKYAELEEHYIEFAGLLVDVVSYSKFHQDSWLNKSFAYKKAEAELEEKVLKVAADWEALKDMGLTYQDAAESVFFDTLDLGAAVQYAKKLEADKERIDNLKVEMEPTEPEPAEEVEPSTPAAEDATKPEPASTAQPEPAPIPAPNDPRRPCVMVIDGATVDEMKAIGHFCGQFNPPITGTFKIGTLLDVCNAAAGGTAYANQPVMQPIAAPAC